LVRGRRWSSAIGRHDEGGTDVRTDAGRIQQLEQLGYQVTIQPAA
jgi:hypothetical protein